MKNIMLLPKTLTRRIITGLTLFGLVATPVLSTQTALAAGTVAVQPNNMQGWTTTNQDLGATVGIVNDSTAQFGQGSLQFHTGCDHDSKAQISKLGLNVPPSSVTEMSYWTKQNAGNTYNYEIPSYQLRLDMDGRGQYVTDFYYYPSANTTLTIPVNATVINSDSNYCLNNSDVSNTVNNTSSLPNAPEILIGTWQKWNVLSGKWASYQPIPGTFDSIPELTPGEGGIDSGIAGAARGGGEFYTITDILRKYPSAKVVGIGSNLGVLYENSTSFADGISINNNIYDFELNAAVPVKKEDCMKNGWQTFGFKNQGKCIDYVKNHGAPGEVLGTILLSNPNQKIKFNIDDNDSWWNRNKKDSIEYWNFDYPENGGVLHYKADVLCVGGDKSNKEARVLYKIPEGHPGLSGLYIGFYVKDVKKGPDLNSQGVAPDLATGRAWCNIGSGISLTPYTVTKGHVNVE